MNYPYAVIGLGSLLSPEVLKT